MKTLSAELVAIIATGVTLAGLLLVSQHRLEERLLANQHRLEDRLLVNQRRLEDRLLAVEREQARTRALLEGAGFAVRPQGSTTGGSTTGRE